MTTSSASARPYSVFVGVPQFYTGFFALKDDKTYIDKGAAPGLLDAYSAGNNRFKTILACLSISMFFWAFPTAAGAISLLSALVKRDYVQLAWVVGLILAWVATVIVSSRYVTRRQKHYDATTALLAEHLVPAPRDDRRDDLYRIQKALNTLQAEHGPDYDDQAREAVAAVLEQNRHRPNEKHLLIADSAAEDPDSVTIRTRTLADKAAWTGDVAKAEHLVLVLEDAAAGKVPAAV
jgi:uncharacterized membrane protein (DUF485 family)